LGEVSFQDLVLGSPGDLSQNAFVLQMANPRDLDLSQIWTSPRFVVWLSYQLFCVFAPSQRPTGSLGPKGTNGPGLPMTSGRGPDSLCNCKLRSQTASVCICIGLCVFIRDQMEYICIYNVVRFLCDVAPPLKITDSRRNSLASDPYIPLSTCYIYHWARPGM